MCVVKDDFAAPGLIESLRSNWPSPESGHWHSYGEWGKLATKNANTLPHAARMLLGQMALLDVPGAFPDLDHLHGSGLHQIDFGGQLGLHLDSERHPLLPWKREASVVLYLDDCDGGEFEICNEKGETLQAIQSKRNRMVMFSTPGTWHRVNPVRSIRRSLCLFFWSIDQNASGASQATFR
jgi:hypothetical protein